MPTARERNTWEQITRLTGRLRPDMSRAILRTGQTLRDTEPSDIERLRAAVNPVRVQLLLALMAGGQYALRALPGRLTFNVLGAAVAPTLYALDQRVTSTLVVMRGGLSPQDVADVERFAQSQHGARAVTAYQNRRITSRAETLARTATLNAFKQGQQLAAGQALREGFFWRGPLMKTWVNMGDARVRDEHSDRGGMGGQTVEWDRPYSNGEMIPGELSWNCRCVSHFSTRPNL